MQPKVPADLLICARWIVPVEPSGAVLENQAIVIADGRIAALGEREALLDEYAVAEIQVRSTHALLPGFVDAAAYFDARLSVNHALAESLRAGTTSLAAYDGRIAELARAVASLRQRVIIALPFAADAGSAAQSERLWDEYRADPYVAFCFAPDSAALNDDAALTRLRSIADELDAPIALSAHLDQLEIDACLRAHRTRPIGRLDRLGLLRPGVMLQGMIALEAQDLERVARSSVAVAARPSSDLRRFHAHAPLSELAARGITIAVATGNGSSTMRSFDMLAEARLAGLLNHFSAARILELATLDGARALGLAAAVGSMQPGKFADLIAVDLATLATQVRRTEDVPEVLAFAATRGEVTDVWLGGRPVVHHGRSLAFDEETLLHRS